MDNQEDFMRKEVVIPEDVQREMLKAQTQDFTRVAQQLVNLTTGLRRIPEPYFYMVLFPIIRDHFTGKKTDRIREWLNIADGMWKEITVYDDLTNEDLFNVPAFNQPTQPVIMTRQEGKRVITPNDLVELQEIHRRNGEHRRYVEIEQTLATVYPIHGRPMGEKDVRNLVAIWNRYDIPLEELFGDQVDAVLQQLAATPDEQVSTDTQPVDDTTQSTDLSDYDF